MARLCLDLVFPKFPHHGDTLTGRLTTKRNLWGDQMVHILPLNLEKSIATKSRFNSTRLAMRQKYSDSILINCSSSVTDAYASRGWALSVRKCGPHLKIGSK